MWLRHLSPMIGWAFEFAALMRLHLSPMIVQVFLLRCQPQIVGDSSVYRLSIKFYVNEHKSFVCAPILCHVRLLISFFDPVWLDINYFAFLLFCLVDDYLFIVLTIWNAPTLHLVSGACMEMFLDFMIWWDITISSLVSPMLEKLLPFNCDKTLNAFEDLFCGILLPYVAHHKGSTFVVNFPLSLEVSFCVYLVASPKLLSGWLCCLGVFALKYGGPLCLPTSPTFVIMWLGGVIYKAFSSSYCTR